MPKRLVLRQAWVRKFSSCHSLCERIPIGAKLKAYMAQAAFRSSAHAEILRKVFDVPGRGMSRPLAESILGLDFPDADAARAEELNAKANDGALTEDERAELDAYANISDLLAYWQSRARQLLQQS